MVFFVTLKIKILLCNGQTASNIKSCKIVLFLSWWQLADKFKFNTRTFYTEFEIHPCKMDVDDEKHSQSFKG